VTRDDALERLLNAVDELTQDRITVSPVGPGYTKARNKRPTKYPKAIAKHPALETHRVTHPSLLAELAEAIYPGGTAVDDGGGRSVPSSQPPAVLAAIDRLEAIEIAVLEWRTRLRLAPRGAIADDIRALIGEAPMLTDDMVGWLTLDVCRWATWARVVTGWQTPPFAPHAPCPACERVGGLRIRLEAKAACCVICGADWDAHDGGIYVLAEHVRISTEGETA
jgi:hypothetical protein